MDALNGDADFSLAKKIPPAFAGILADWKMGSREITATVIDLIVRDFLLVSGNRLVWPSKKSGLKGFEQAFLSTLFGNTENLSFEEVEQSAYRKNAEELLKIISRGMIEEGLVDKDFQKKLAEGIQKAVQDTLGTRAKINITKNTPVYQVPTWIGKPLLALFGIKPIFDSIEKKAQQNLGGSWEEGMLTAEGKKQKQEALKLKAFMEKFPLLEDRLANELVAHAIAFGIGKRWLNKLGGKSAWIKQWIESLESSGDTTTRFIDWNSYLKEFRG